MSGDSLANSEDDEPVVQKRHIVEDDEDEDEDGAIGITQRSKRQRAQVILSDDE